jgi:hypothetical protein
MPQKTDISIPDENYQAVLRAAMAAGLSVEQWILRQICLAAPSDAQRKEALQGLLKFAGCVDGDFGSSDNAAIDRDLAREYGNTHEEDEAA